MNKGNDQRKMSVAAAGDGGTTAPDSIKNVMLGGIIADKEKMKKAKEKLLQKEAERLEKRVACTPTDKDVLCGRGCRHQSHPGNASLLRFVEEHSLSDSTIKRRDKIRCAKQAFEKFKKMTKARFLKKESDGEFYELDDQQAYIKMAGMLRYGGLDHKKYQQNKVQQQDMNVPFPAESTASATRELEGTSLMKMPTAASLYHQDSSLAVGAIKPRPRSLPEPPSTGCQKNASHIALREQQELLSRNLLMQHELCLLRQEENQLKQYEQCNQHQLQEQHQQMQHCYHLPKSVHVSHYCQVQQHLQHPQWAAQHNPIYAMPQEPHISYSMNPSSAYRNDPYYNQQQQQPQQVIVVVVPAGSMPLISTPAISLSSHNLNGMHHGPRPIYYGNNE